MSTAPAEAKKKCRYKSRLGWACPFDAEPDHDRCIFHLPVQEKDPEDFWRQLASYLDALSEHALTEGPGHPEFGPNRRKLALARDRTLRDDYFRTDRTDLPWRFTGFVFPAMDEVHCFQQFVFAATDFSGATFSAGAHFRDAAFNGKASFQGAGFSGQANFEHARFTGKANFCDARFNGWADFTGAEFGAGASFESAKFCTWAIFMGAKFSGEAYFAGAKFIGTADFAVAQLSGETYFGGASFADGAFWGTTFTGPAYLIGTTVNGLLDFSRATLRNRLLFEGTIIADTTGILLWGLDFVHGTSDITMEKEHLKGQVVEPAGQVVFRDISTGMNRVSFLHTDILTDRLCVHFANVKWKNDPREFIFDARFAFCRDASKWQKATGLPADRTAHLPELFHTVRPAPSEETEKQKRQREAKQMADCVPLVRQDVERVAREIRLSHEKYGNYPDAGNYYVAEMDFRRARLPRRAWLKRPAMWFYWLVSRYGESPGRAASVLLGVIGVGALVYLFTGFAFQGEHVQRVFTLNPRQWTLPVLDYLKALLFALANVVPGYFRIQSDKLASTSGWTTAVSMLQAVLGVTTLTLFLLAVRRRFRR